MTIKHVLKWPQELLYLIVVYVCGGWDRVRQLILLEHFKLLQMILSYQMNNLLSLLLKDFLLRFSFLLFQAKVIDVSYGNIDDLKRIKKMRNVTNQIALLKLGKLPLLYKVGPMAVFFGGGMNVLFQFIEVLCLCILCVCTCVCVYGRGWRGPHRGKSIPRRWLFQNRMFSVNILKKKEIDVLVT